MIMHKPNMGGVFNAEGLRRKHGRVDTRLINGAFKRSHHGQRLMTGIGNHGIEPLYYAITKPHHHSSGILGRSFLMMDSVFVVSDWIAVLVA
jgi:hypothetical protein